MSLLRLTISQFFTKLRYNSNFIVHKQAKTFPVASQLYSTATVDEGDSKTEEKDRNEAKDRTKIIPVETSIEYLASNAYKTTYGNKLVWEEYRRNHKGALAPRKTRRTCIRKGEISTGNPCPICRDEYLVLDHRNSELLKQFISPYSGEVS